MHKAKGVCLSVCLSVWNHFSCVWLYATSWTVSLRTPLFLGFSRQENQRGLPCPPPGDLSDPGIEPMFLMSPALAGRFFMFRTMWKRDSRLLWKWVTTAGSILESTNWWIEVLRGDVCPLNFSGSVPNLVAIRTQGHALCWCSRCPLAIHRSRCI